MSDLVGRLRIKAGMIEMGELIAWGSDSALMREAADALEENAKLRAELERRESDGWKLVPLCVTSGMEDAYDDKCAEDGIEHELYMPAYESMLAAAPSAPKADDPVKQMLLEALNGMLLHIREPESESEFQWPEHFKKQKAAFAAARAAIVAARKGEGE